MLEKLNIDSSLYDKDISQCVDEIMIWEGQNMLSFGACVYVPGITVLRNFYWLSAALLLLHSPPLTH